MLVLDYDMSPLLSATGLLAVAVMLCFAGRTTIDLVLVEAQCNVHLAVV